MRCRFLWGFLYRSYLFIKDVLMFARRDLTSRLACLPVSPHHVLIKHRFHCIFFCFYFSANRMPSCFFGAHDHADDCLDVGVAVAMPTAC